MHRFPTGGMAILVLGMGVFFSGCKNLPLSENSKNPTLCAGVTPDWSAIIFKNNSQIPGLEADPARGPAKTTDRPLGLMEVPGALTVAVYDGDKNLAPVPIIVKKSAEGLSWKAQDGSLTGRLVLKAEPPLLKVRLELRTAVPQGRKLKVDVGLGAPIGGAVQYWDGIKVWPAPSVRTTDQEQKRLFNKFPLSALFNDKVGYAFGLQPETLVSYLEFTYDPAAKTLWCGLRPMLFPDRPVIIDLAVFAFDPAFGKLSAAQAYYDAFPRAVRPQVNIDPRIYSSCASGAEPKSFDPEWKKKAGKSDAFSLQERHRRGRAQWNWFYCPYYIGGDFTGEYIGTYRNEVMIKHYGKRSEDKTAYLDWKRSYASLDSKQNIALLHYILTWSEEPFMQKYFPEAIKYREKDILTGIAYWIKDWGHVGWGKTIRIFPWEPAWRAKAMRDLDAIFTELPNAGISWDCYDYFGDLFRGRGIEDTGAASWDEDGPYCNDATAAALLARYIRQKKTPRGYNACLIGNMGRIYANTFNADGFILERNPATLLLALSASVESMRLLWGSKIINQYHIHNQSKLGDYMDYQSLTPEQIRKACADFTKHFVLFCFRYGITIGPDFVNGYEYAMKMQPLLQEVMKAGWQPATAMRGPERFWYSRFGHDLGSYLCVGNPGTNASKEVITVLNRWIGGEGGYVPFAADGKEFTSRVEAERTAFDVTLGQYQPAVVELLMAARSAGPLQAVTSRETLCHRIAYKADFHGQGKVELACRIPEDFGFQEASLDGQPLAPVAIEERIARFQLAALVTNKVSVFRVAFRSQLFHSPEAAILDFPFTTNNVPAVVVVIPDTCMHGEDLLAAQVREYFRYYFASALQKEALLPIVKAGEVKVWQNVVALGEIAAAPAEPGVTVLPQNVLALRPRAGHDLNQDLFALMYLLDKRYPVIGTIDNGSSYVRPDAMESKKTKEMLDKARLFGATLFEDGR